MPEPVEVVVARIEQKVDDVIRRLDSMNGKIAENTRNIVTLRVRDAYWAGGVAVLLVLARWVLG